MHRPQQLHNLLGYSIEIGVDGRQIAGRLVLVEVAVKGDLVAHDAHLTIERIGLAGVDQASGTWGSTSRFRYS